MRRRGICLPVIVLLGALAPGACSSRNGHGCPGAVTATLTGVMSAGPKRGALPSESRAGVTLDGTVGWKAKGTGTVIDNRRATGDLPAPVTTTTAEVAPTTSGFSFGPTTLSPVKIAPDAGGRPFTATATFGRQTLTVKGTVVGPPAPCHGVGGWTLTSSDNSQTGGGSWSF